MDNKGEVKKILLQPTIQTGKPIMNEFAAGQLARQICRLFPKTEDNPEGYETGETPMEAQLAKMEHEQARLG